MKKMVIVLIVVFYMAINNSSFSQTVETNKNMEGNNTYKKALSDYEEFKILVDTVDAHRKARLISLDVFLSMSKEPNVVILDTRSEFRYLRKHLKGAVHLSFTDFTQENLRKMFPDSTTKILIYCNNNFEGDQIDFASKVAMPEKEVETQILSNRKPIMLALNIPTYINLYGYGYRNIFELDELVHVKDVRIKFEGTEVK
jgi:hypothetical protein